jgi:hypothetical protein
VSFDSVNSEKCGQLLEVVIAFIRVSIFYCGVVSTFVIEIKSYVSFLVCPEQKFCKHTPISFALYAHMQHCKKWEQIFVKFKLLSVTAVCVCVKILFNVKAYMYSMCTPCMRLDKYLFEWKIFRRELSQKRVNVPELLHCGYISVVFNALLYA